MSSLKQDNNNFYTNEEDNISTEFKAKKVNLTDLVARLKEEKRQDKKHNVILSAAAISAVAVFGIILTL
jgi:tellurite resistance protein